MPAKKSDDHLERYVSLAQELENSTEVQARKRLVDERQKLYHLEWSVERAENVHYQVDTDPKVVAERAMAKLMAQPPVITCIQDAKMLHVQQTADMLIELGFEVFDRWERELWALSFWRTLQRKNHPDTWDERLRFESVIAGRKAVW